MLRTERLTVRRVRAGDGDAIRSIWAAVAKTPYARFDRPNDTEKEAVARRIARWASFADSTEHMFFAVCLNGAVIGYVAFHQREDGCESGYCFHPDVWGKGYARESVSALLEHLRALGIRRVTAGTALGNGPSVRLLNSLGFRMTGTEKVSFYRDEAGNDIVFDGGIWELSLRDTPARGGLPECRRLLPSEIGPLGELQRAYKFEIGEDAPSESDMEALAKAIAEERILFFGAWDGPVLTGCCSVTVGFSTFGYAPCGVFEDFYVRPAYRHRGIARELVKTAYRESGVLSMTVGCADCDVPMYRALGFTVRLGNLLALE